MLDLTRYYLFDGGMGTMLQERGLQAGGKPELLNLSAPEVVRDIQQRCRETMIQDGSCGVRELISWVQSAMILGNPFESALYTVISSASADPENREELINTCLEPIFARR